MGLQLTPSVIHAPAKYTQTLPESRLAPPHLTESSGAVGLSSPIPLRTRPNGTLVAPGPSLAVHPRAFQPRSQLLLSVPTPCLSRRRHQPKSRSPHSLQFFSALHTSRAQGPDSCLSRLSHASATPSLPYCASRGWSPIVARTPVDSFHATHFHTMKGKSGRMIDRCRSQLVCLAHLLRQPASHGPSCG